MKCLVDINLSPAWVTFLGAAGIDAVHWSSVGPAGATDLVLMQWAAERGHVVLTADLDFSAILAASRDLGPSVIQIRSESLLPAAIGAAVLSAIRQTADELRAGAIVSVDTARGQAPHPSPQRPMKPTSRR